jgi:methylated-DNA-[protein]-cysteine S-methyltransferase
MSRQSRDPAITGMLNGIEAPTSAEFEALRARLGERAERAGLLDVAYRIVDSPVGALLLAATSAGVVRVAYEREDFDVVLTRLVEKVSPRVIADARRLDPVVRQLEEYFVGSRESFDVPTDLRLAAGFRRRVLEHLPAIGYGHTASYAVVAAAVDNPRAVRAVGSACATNPLPLILPCHRVVRSDGAIGEYVGGADNKRHLLELETAA